MQVGEKWKEIEGDTEIKIIAEVPNSKWRVKQYTDFNFSAIVDEDEIYRRFKRVEEA